MKLRASQCSKNQEVEAAHTLMGLEICIVSLPCIISVKVVTEPTKLGGEGLETIISQCERIYGKL